MKFHCSDFFDYQGNPRPWADYGLNERESIDKYFNDHIRVLDADTCDDETFEFVFENGKAFKLDYTYWIEYNPHWDLKSETNLREIPLDEVKTAMKKYRDIMGTPQYTDLPRA